MNEKKVVFYSDVAKDIVVGQRTVVWPIDHTSTRVINGEPAITTRVENYDQNTGVFETFNTIYKPNIILG